ncbi:MAG: ATP-binding protein, partial [Bacteroidota bacterium]
MKIVITGPESSGKTTLAKGLAQYYKTSWVPEYSRTYLDKLSRPYDKSDLLAIAKGQAERENSYVSQATSFIICDTSMLVLKVWSLYKYQSADPWITEKVLSKDYTLFLLCQPDLPWEYDPLRENPEDRDVLFEMYHKELLDHKLPFVIIEGLERE